MIPVLLAVAMLFAVPRALAQGCVARPSELPLDGAALARIPHLHGGRAALVLPGLPGGQDCTTVAPPVGDILRGEAPPAGGLLRDDGGRTDLLRQGPVLPR